MSERLIVRMKFGSHLYGLNTKDSDTDYKGIFMPSWKDILLSRVPKNKRISSGSDNGKNTIDDVDEEHYSLHYFVKMASQGITVALDMLHASNKAIIETTDVWEALRGMRSVFYTKNLNSLIGYAQHQAAKYGIKGSRLAAAKEVLALFESCKPGVKIKDIWHLLPTGEHLRKVVPGCDQLNYYQVCGKKYIETSTITHYLPNLQEFVKRYGPRAKQAEKSEGVDWKAISHAFRAAYQVKHILLDGGFEYPLPETAYLKKIKAGKVPYPEAGGALEDLIDEVQKLSDKSTLREKVNTHFVDTWLTTIILREYAS